MEITGLISTSDSLLGWRKGYSAPMDDRALQLWRFRKRPRGQCSSAGMGGDYDVFLNHRGPDVKAGFISHLDEALRAAGFNPFLDKASSKKGHPAFTSIKDALEVAKIHVVVISKGYAESKYCLSELVTIMRSGKPVVPVFYDVEPVQLRWVESGPFAAAFEKHKLKRAEEQVEAWRDALRKLADITGLCFRLSDYKGDERELKWEVVDAISSMTSTNFEELEVECHLVGVEEHVNTCINKLKKMSDVTCLLGLVGMGGVGKTTIAKEIYNHFVVHKKFQASSFLEVDRHSSSRLEVRQSLLSRLQEQFLWDLFQLPGMNQHRYNYWFHKLLKHGPILVVLDDICERSQFDEVILNKRLLAPGSCIIITSRDQHLLKVIGGESNFQLHEVLPLKCDDAEKLFNLHAFDNEEAPEKFKALANDVRRGCGGLPLALKVVGSSLFDKRRDEDLEYIWSEAVDALKEDSTVMNALKWSYDCLSKQEKLMFVDIACVFYGWKKQEALEIWKSCKKCSLCCGFGAPHTTLNKLIEKSLVVLEHIDGSSDVLAMHRLLQDLCENIGMNDGSHLLKDNATKVVEDKNQGSLSNVRALNLSNTQRCTFESENFGKMSNLHFLILDGCNVSGDLGSISKELRWLRWRYMPLMQSPPILNFSRLISLDFSESMELTNIWAESNSSLEACPNLLYLYLRRCISINTLPDSIGSLSRLQELHLNACINLQKLPSSIGQLTALQILNLFQCISLEALPDSITALSRLQFLNTSYCPYHLKLPTTCGLMTGLTHLCTDLPFPWHAVAIGQLNALKELIVAECTEEAINVLVSSSRLKSLYRLTFLDCHSLTKFPEAIGLLTNLDWLEIDDCWKLRKLPNSMGQLKVLTALRLRRCPGLKTLPGSVGALACLQKLSIYNCISLTKLPTSMDHLSNLRSLRLECCGALQSLPEWVRQLDALVYLMILDCGSLQGMGVVRALQGLRIWGCTSITELPGSCLMVVDSNIWHPDCYDDVKRYNSVYRELKQLQVVEANDCGMLRLVSEPRSRRVIWQRVHKLPCCNPRVSDLCSGGSMEVGESSNMGKCTASFLIPRYHNEDAI